MRPLAVGLLLGIFLLLGGVAEAAPTLTPIGSFSRPVLVTAPAGDPHRLFVVQRNGIVQVVRDGATLAQPFLDISADVDPDRVGLASVAFAPGYDTGGYVYVLYDAPDAAGTTNGVDVVVDRYTRSASDPDRVDPASRLQVLRLDFSNTHDHDADHLEFGPDGLLYIAVGEGLDDFDKSQDPHAMRGKLLRIDPLPDGSYRIPRGNPYANSGGDPRVFAYGLRNPWRFSFDLNNRQIAIADVGDGGGEEVDVLNIDTGGGENLGWPCWEGNHIHNAGTVCQTPPVQTPPVFEYQHTGGRCAIIGGYVVRDPNLPGLVGRYVYGDFCTGEIRSIALDSASTSDSDAGVSVPSFGLASFGEDGCGHLFVMHQDNPAPDPPGVNVWRIDDGTYAPCPEPQKPAEPPATEPPPSTSPTPPTDGTPNPGPEPGPVVAPPDKTPPRLWLTGARAQRVARNGRIVIGARCGEPCRLTANARVTRGPTSAVRHFLPVSRSAPALTRVKLSLRLTPKARRALRALRRGERALVRVRVTARDSAGNSVTRTRYVVAVG